MQSTAEGLALIVCGIVLIIVLLMILAMVHKQALRMRQLEKEMKLFEKAHETKEEEDGKKSIL